MAGVSPDDGLDDVSPEELELDRRLPPATIDKAVSEEYMYARFGLVAGIVVILIGGVITALGLTGTVQWHINGLGLDSTLQTSALGVVFIVVGLILVGVTRPKVAAK